MLSILVCKPAKSPYSPYIHYTRSTLYIHHMYVYNLKYVVLCVGHLYKPFLTIGFRAFEILKL